MYSSMTAVGVGAVMFAFAVYKGRTGWHWFVLSLFAFAAIWLFSVVSLYIANVHFSLGGADRRLAPFAGSLTCLVVVVLLVAVPFRPRRHAPPGDAVRRRSEL